MTPTLLMRMLTWPLVADGICTAPARMLLKEPRSISTSDTATGYGRISTNPIERQCFLGRDPEDMFPWGLFFAYRICGAHMQSTEKVPHGSEVVKSLREALLTIDRWWNVASVYLQLLEAQETMHLGN
jgi:hypothetical protein